MSKHLKRLNAPRTIKLHRKGNKWTIKAKAGAHPLNYAIPLGIIVRDYLRLCNTSREALRVISNGDILVDNIPRKSHKFACGFMDVISIPKQKKQYRILFDQRGILQLIPISTSGAEWKLCQIKNKTTLKDNKIQLNFHDGRNALVKKDEYHTGDVLKINFKDNKISDVYQFKKGNVSMITGGTHIGQIASIDDVEMIPSSKPNLAKMKGESEYSTLQKYVFPIGKHKPVIELPEVKIQ